MVSSFKPVGIDPPTDPRFSWGEDGGAQAWRVIIGSTPPEWAYTALGGALRLKTPVEIGAEHWGEDGLAVRTPNGERDAVPGDWLILTRAGSYHVAAQK